MLQRVVGTYTPLMVDQSIVVVGGDRPAAVVGGQLAGGLGLHCCPTLFAPLYVGRGSQQLLH